MKIGIVHFTDLHFTIRTNINNKVASCLNALKNDFYSAKKVYFVISGDIAYSGLSSEYESATKFFNLLKQLLEKELDVDIRLIIVPGNHDCDFDKDSQNRRNALQGINYEKLGDDNSVIENCLAVQHDFWDFYQQYNSIPEDKLYYHIVDIYEDIEICFHCVNTSWTSAYKEKPGSLFFPVKRYLKIQNETPRINIGVYHHPYNWFTPNTPENNKKEFQTFMESTASVSFIGHEHENEFYSNENMLTGDSIQLLSGKVFHKDNNPNVSGFETILLDTDTSDGNLKLYDWAESFYNSSTEGIISFRKDEVKKFELKPEFLKSLDEIKIPLTIGERKQIRLSELYIFPDLDPFRSDVKILDNYKDSIGLLSDKFNHSVICGDDQIGKSSLLNVIYQKKYNDNYYPILVNGRDIKELDLNKTIKRAFKLQYDNSENIFEAYIQLEKKKKILLLDDYQNCSYNASNFYLFLKEAMDKFDKVIITIDAEHSMLPIIQSEFKEIDFFRIKPLGYSKRNALIEQYHYLKNLSLAQSHDEADLVKESYDKVTAVLGDKLIPAYPIYVLSILQALEYSSLKQNETSFGYCYQTLIHLALHKSGVKNEDMDTYFNFLSELAYTLIRDEKEVMFEDEMLAFYMDYKKRFICPLYEVIIRILKDSKILLVEKDEIYFGYDYILYYLSAKKIADIIHTVEGKNIITKLFTNVHIEKNGNILVFITHHSKDIGFIEESLLNSMIVLSDFEPITLALDDPFYGHIKEIANQVSKDILQINKNAKEEREKQLKMLDERESMVHDEPSENQLPEHINKLILPFKKSFRAIEIIGQIIRNRKGSLEIPQLKEMIREVYITGFRTISYNSQLLLSAKDQLIIALNDEDFKETNKTAIEKSVNEFVMMSSYEACLGIFGKIINSMGIKDLKSLFLDVSEEMNTPAAKLVSFAINSYYGSISESELKKIIKELGDNPVAMKILRSRVKTYVYSRNLPVPTKQKFASLLGMTIGPSIPMTHRRDR